MNYNDIIQLRCTEINAMPEDIISDIIDVVIDHYYKEGFPYYPIDKDKIKMEFDYLIDYDVSQLELADNHLQQNMKGLNTVNSFHPQMWHVQCNNAKTPFEIFQDRNSFKVALRKRIKYSDTKLAPFNIRKSLKAFGTQSVSNFKPTIAKWVYQNYCPAGGSVLDPCMGYGGRMMGAMASHIGSYFGVDPDFLVYRNNLFLHEALTNAGSNVKVILNQAPFEIENSVEEKEFDLVFTSPPYFNIEKYSLEAEQSYIKYPTYNEWKDKFLGILIKKSHFLLRSGGYLALNVGRPIDKDTYEIGSDVFGCEPIVYHMRLSKFLGNGTKNTISHKIEPIFIWRKDVITHILKNIKIAP